jgi:glycosyltransferase involved in cell wall biosynthesis
MRYVWDKYYDYLEDVGRVTRLLFKLLIHYLRIWDLASASRVDYFIANSKHVAKRVMKHYRREAEVIYPPVDTSAFSPATKQDEFYLMVGQLVRYKRADLAVEAFNKARKRLVIIGEGEQLTILKKRARGNISILGYQPFPVIQDHYARCRALIFPGVEDFGMVPVEAMASGRPVLAFGKGGALETVRDGVTGLFFDEQTPESIIDAVERYEKMEKDFSPVQIIQHAQKFDKNHFVTQFHNTINRLTQQVEST